MNFALLGDHPDGLEIARALSATGRHVLRAYSGPILGAERLARWGLTPQRVGDIEEILADPQILLVVVASPKSQRSAVARRAMQAERHVLCVHPVADASDAAYEIGFLQTDVHKVLLPLRAEGLHPGVRRLAELAQEGLSTALLRPESVHATHDVDPLVGVTSTRHLPPEFPRLIELEITSTDAVLADAEGETSYPSVPGWDALRLLGGEIVEVFGFSPPAELTPDEVVIVAGRYLSGAMFRATLTPFAAHDTWTLSAVRSANRLSLHFPEGWPGRATLREVDGDQTVVLEEYESFDPWQALIEEAELVLAELERQTERPAPGTLTQESVAKPGSVLGWLDEIRALELDEATRRGVERRRSSSLEYVEAAEEAGFKGTMTLFGCALLWSALVLLILSVWLPWLGWLIAPVFAIFIGMQWLGWLIPGAKPTDRAESKRPTNAIKSSGERPV